MFIKYSVSLFLNTRYVKSLIFKKVLYFLNDIRKLLAKKN